MTAATLTIRVVEDGDEWLATEPHSDVGNGRGETRHDAVIDYVERARVASQEAQT